MFNREFRNCMSRLADVNDVATGSQQRSDDSHHNIRRSDSVIARNNKRWSAPFGHSLST
jgi:hypothetical protein